MTGPATEVAPRRAAPESRQNREDPEREPAAPVIPNELLQLMTGEDAPARALLWEWQRMVLPAPPPVPATMPVATTSAPTSSPPIGAVATDEEGADSAGADRDAEREPAQARAGEPGAAPGGEPAVGSATEPGGEEGAERVGETAPTGPGEPAAAGPEAEPTGEVDLTGSSSMQAWGDQVRAATARRIRAPAPPDLAPASGAIAARTAHVGRRESKRRARALSDVRGAVPRAPDLPVPPTPPAIPKPEVEQRIAEVVGKHLPEQTLPVLTDYTHVPASGRPQVFKTKVAPIPLPEGSLARLTPIPPPRPTAREARRRIRAVREASERLAPVAARGAFTLGTVPAPGQTGAPAAPRVAKVDIAGVLARLHLGITTDAQTMLREIRTGMYHGALQQKLNDFGGDLLPDLETRMAAAVDAIATQAGVDLEVVHGATTDAAGKVVLGAERAKARVTKAEHESRAETTREGEHSTDVDAGAAAGAAALVDATLLSAQGGATPAEIRAQRDRLMARVHRKLAPDDVRYEREGADRQQALQQMSGLYTAAYLEVARQVRERIRRDTGPAPSLAPAPTPAFPPPDPTPAPDPAPALAPTPPLGPNAATAAPAPPPVILVSPADAWAVDRKREVKATFDELRKEASDATAALRAGITDAATFARRVLDEWVQSEVEDQEMAWDTMQLKVDAWGRDALDRTQAWEEARSAMLGADLRSDIAFVADLASGARTQAEAQGVGALGGLSDAQRAIVTAYFNGDPPRDPLGAVAAGMRMRITQVHRPRITEELDRRLYALPKERWPDVAVVASGDGDTQVDIKSRGRQFYAAVDQWGTDESKLYAALTGLTKLQRHALDLWYQQEHGHTIEWELKDELEDAELDRAQALMAGDQLAADAAAIRDAIEGPGTDEQEIYRALRNKKPEERARLEEIYQSRYGTSLQEDLDSDMDGQEFQRADALRVGDQRKADAIGLEMAKTGRWHGGPDTDAIQDIYAQNRLEVEQEAQAKGWTAAQMHDQNLARIGEIDQAHRQQYRDGEKDGEGLKASFEATLTGPALDLALGLNELDFARADAARLELEKRSFITDDKVVTKILESQYDRAETEARLDAEHRLAYRADLAAVRGEVWDQARDKREREAMEGEVKTEAGRRAEGYMDGLKSRYNALYATDLMSLQFGRGGFDELIEDGLQGSDEDRAKALVAAHGRLNPAEEIKYAVQGAGTDVDVLKRMLDGKTKAQILEIERQWEVLYPKGPSLRDRIMDDVSGRDAIDLDEMLMAPETPREKYESAVRRQQFEDEGFSLGATFGEEERKALDDDVKALKEAADEYDRLVATPNPDPARIDYLKWRATQETKAVSSAIEEHRRNADSVTDKLAMVAAVVAGAIVTALTWGAAGPLIAGALGALAAAEATIITKMVVKGAAYSEEELLVDVVSGAVDIVMALATFGIGNAMMRVTKGVPVGRLARLATSASRAKRMVAHGVANGVEGLVGGIPSGAAGALADEKTWSQGNVLTTVLTGTAMGAASGAVMGGLMGSAGGWKAAPIPLNIPPGSMPDAAARSAQWQVHQRQHPTASFADFAADFDAGRIRPDANAAVAFQRAAQDAVAAGLPRAERKILDGVAVTVLSEAEFSRVTRSSKAHAVTIVENGKPRIVMKESAPLSALREEGIHVAQALDPKLAGHFKMLDEAVLAGWDQLPLGTKLAVYAAKLDLEVDANARLLRGLREEARGMLPGGARNALLDRAAEVRGTLRTLLARQGELVSFSVLDRLRARLGTGLLASRLDQPARLFNKAAAKVAKAKKQPAIPPPAPKVAKKPSAPKAAKPTKTAAPNPSSWGAPPDQATAPRRTLAAGERSPQEGQKGVLSVKQVGEPWHDLSVRGKQRTPAADAYRMVEVEFPDPKAPNGIRTKRFHETVVRGSKPPRWVKRGSHAAEAGDVAEEASLAMTRRYIAKMQRKGVKVVTLGSRMQNESGQGFDEVYFEFHRGGRVEVVVVEVKDYTGRRVPFGDFTAITGGILKKNLSTLRDLVALPRGMLPPGLQALSDSQLGALRKKVAGVANAGAGLTLEVRLGATTGLGGQKQLGRQDAALPKLQGLFHSRPVRQGRLSAAEVDLAARVTEVDLPEASTTRLLDTHAALARRGIVDPVIVPLPDQPGVFTGPSGRATTFRAVTPTDVGGVRNLDQAKLTAIADDTVAQLKRQLVTAPGKAPTDLNVVLDLSGVNADSRRRVMAAIDSALAATGQASTLRHRLHVEPRPRRTLGTRP